MHNPIGIVLVALLSAGCGASVDSSDAILANQGGSTLYVDAAAAPGGIGTAAAPFATIQEALAAADGLPGSVLISVAPGDYDIHTAAAPGEEPRSDLLLERPHTTLHARSVLTVDADGLPTGYRAGTEVRLNVRGYVQFQYGLVEIEASDVEVRGFVLDGADFSGWSNGIVANGAVGKPLEDVRIRDNTVRDMFAAITLSLASGEVTRNRTESLGHVANVITGGENATPAEVEVAYNRFTGQDVAGVCYFGATELPGAFFAGAPQPAGALKVYVHHNDVSGNYGVGVQTSPRGAFPYSYTTAKLRAVVEHNRIVDNAGPGVIVESGECFFQACPDQGAPADTHLSVSGNLISGNGGGTAYFSTDRPGSDIPLHDSSIVVNGDIASLGDFVWLNVGPRNTVRIGGKLYR